MFIYKQRKHIYLACYILWVLTTILYLYLLTYSSNFIIDFYWGNYNYYILLSILMFFILVITRKKIFFKFKIVKTINKIIIISLLILIALNQSFRIYNAFISNQKISITSVSNKLLKLENLEELDMLSDNYNIINNSYISKKSFLIQNYYKTS